MKKVVCLILSILCIMQFTSCAKKQLDDKEIKTSIDSDAVIKNNDQIIKCHVKNDDLQKLEITITEPDELSGMTFNINADNKCIISYKGLQFETNECNFLDSSFVSLIKSVTQSILNRNISQINCENKKEMEYLEKHGETDVRITINSSNGEIRRIVSDDLEIEFCE